MDHQTIPPGVVALANELAQAVEIIMDSNTSQQSRMEAYVACERFKEASPLCAQAGLYLASGQQYNTNVKHFGMQLIEHTIKFKWNSITQQEKLFIKENAMKLLLTGVGPAEDTRLSHMKDALSRIIVEMIKREWPQQWTTLLSELSDACSKGEAQTELVLLIFLRLVEDVALLQTLESNQRRKDIYQALTVKMNEIFDFFLRLIEMHVNAFRNTTAIGNLQKASAHSRVVQVALLTLTGFVEWVSINHIMCSDGKLLHILCILLNDVVFRIDAAECLSQIVNRKGQLRDRKPLLILFNDEPIHYIYRASTIQPIVQSPIAAVPSSSSPSITTEQNYIFLKKLSQILNGLGQQLTTLWGKEDGAIGRPINFSTYLESVFTITQHPSLTLTHSAVLIWNNLLKHEQISKDPIFLEYIPKVIEIVGPRVIKISYPHARPVVIAPTIESFISMEYDSEDEFTIFFYRCRTDILEIFRQGTLVAPLVTFAYCEHWLSMRLAKSVTEKNTTCSIQDPIYLEWEALVAVLDSVLSRVLMVSERPSVASGLHLLEECLKVNTTDPLIFSILLSCISALFVFLSMSSCQITAGNCVAMTGVSLLPRVLDKIFAALIFVEPNTESSSSSTVPLLSSSSLKSSRSQAIRNLRRHAASLMVKLGHKYPLLLLPVFEQINTTVKGLNRQSQSKLSKMEEVTLQEALLLISNHFCDYDRQTNFIGEIMHEAQILWIQLTPIFKSSADFICFIGLDKSPPDDIEHDGNSSNRSKIMDALHIVLGVIKRCTWPDDPDRASRGGFVIGLTESGNPICRNPATPHIVPLLPHILSLLRVLNELFKPESLQLLSDGYRNVHAMLDHEKKVLMGVPPVLTDPMDPIIKKIPTSLERMQQFVTSIFEGCYHMMGSAGPCLGRDLYQLPGISNALINSSFASLEYIPDYRLRPIIRVFLKPFIYSCPPAFYESVLLPIFIHLAPFMLNRLTIRWQYITSLYESGELNEEINDTQEVLEDMLNRTLTREYLEVLKVALVGGALPTNDRDGLSTIDSTMDQDDHSVDGHPQTLTRAAQSAMAAEVISDLGGKLLKNQLSCTPIVMTILNSIAWNDSLSSLKAVYLAGPVIRYLSSEQLLTSVLATNILISVLQGLQVHGQHDTNQPTLITLGVQVYEILRPKFPSVFEIMQQIPNINNNDLQKLDEKIALGSTKGNKIDKAKKDLFKKITAQLIGRNINQLFRQEIQIANLPAITTSTGRTTSHNNILDTNQESGLVNLFNPSRKSFIFK